MCVHIFTENVLNETGKEFELRLNELRVLKSSEAIVELPDDKCVVL